MTDVPALEGQADQASSDAVRPRASWASWWGIVGVIALLGHAIWRLTPKALETFTFELTVVQWVVLGVVVLFMAYSEGYKGFQKAFSPRVASRALHVGQRSVVAQVLSPIFCMALFDATKKRLIVSWVLVTMIVLLIISVSFLSDPWRGIVDVGVVVGLGWGLLATLAHFFRALGGAPLKDPELG